MMDRNESGGDSNDSINADDEARSRCSEPASKNDGSAADVHDHDDGEQRSDNSSSDESSSSGNSSSISETSSRNSYDSERSDSEEESSGGSYDSDSFSGDSSHASHESQQSSRSSSGKSTNAPTQLNHKSSSFDQTAPLSNNVPTNYSTNRIFHQGGLPSMSRGLAPQQPYQGNDRNCDPNASTLIHRRGKSAKELDFLHSSDTLQEQNQPQCRPEDCANDKGKHESSRSSSRHNRRRGKSSRHYQKQKKKTKSSSNCCIKYFCCQTKKRSTQILILSFSIWVLAQCYYFYYWSLKDFFLDNAGSIYSDFFDADNHQGGRGSNGREKKVIHQSDYLNHRDLYEKHSPAEMETLREQRAKEARAALGTGAGDFDPTDFRRDTGGKRRKANSQGQKGGRKGSRDPEGNTRTERLRDGCSALEWHSYHFPNCNEIHEIDLGRAVRHRQSRKNGNDSTTASSQHTFPWGFVGNGLWRDVFSCDPREETVADGLSNAVSPPLPPAVLKIMKSEHPYDQRNFQRHRRDALVMERLSSSHHLVAIYGYCANTVLTQAISHTLDDVIYARENERVKKWSPHGGYKTKPPLESWMGKDEDGDLLATRENELGRIRLALGVFRGLMDLHEGDGTVRNREWLPVVHADIQSKQYLVDAQTGQIYLNDFNRCRFVTKADRPVNSTANKSSASGTLEKCPLYIPSAPGAARSPEEYQFAPLSEKLDIYSAGNILYGIITGNRPWNDERGKHIKAAIKKGERPPVDDAIRNAEGTVDAELTRLLDWVYEGDPMKRASAKEIVGELEKMLERELERKVPLQGKGEHASYLAEHEEQQEEEQVQTLRRRL